jgi:hypothetical protein
MRQTANAANGNSASSNPGTALVLILRLRPLPAARFPWLVLRRGDFLTKKKNPVEISRFSSAY